MERVATSAACVQVMNFIQRNKTNELHEAIPWI